MPNDHQSVTITDLVQVTGESKRTLQHWADNGVVIPIPATIKQGPGKVRQFRADELYWSLVASAINRRRTSVSELSDVLSSLRDSVATNELSAVNWELAKRGKAQVFALLLDSGRVSAGVLFNLKEDRIEHIAQLMSGSEVTTSINITLLFKRLRHRY